MTAAERVYRIALRAYPPEYRRERGAEILATLDEMGAGSSRPSPRQVAALAAGGVRERGARTTGGTRAGVWTEGCTLAALVLLVLSAAAAMYPIGWDVWYGRLGMTWPIADYRPVVLSGGGLARAIVAAALPWAAAAAVCRGRTLLAIAGPLLSAALFLSGTIGFGGVMAYESWPAGQSWLANAYQLGNATFLAAPAALLWVGARGRSRTGVRRSQAWLAVPLVLGILHIGFWATTITFWPLAVLVVAWFLAARLSPHLAVAAFGVLVPVLAFVLPTALGAPAYQYAIAVATGAVVLATASLASAIAFGDDAELDRPVV